MLGVGSGERPAKRRGVSPLPPAPALRNKRHTSRHVRPRCAARRLPRLLCHPAAHARPNPKPSTAEPVRADHGICSHRPLPPRIKVSAVAAPVIGAALPYKELIGSIDQEPNAGPEVGLGRERLEAIGGNP